MPRLSGDQVAIPTFDWWPDAPWAERQVGRPVDRDRTARLHQPELNLTVRCHGKVPLDLTNGTPLYSVYDSKLMSPWWKPLPKVRIPVPPVVHVDVKNPDSQVFFMDEGNRVYYELSAFRPTAWFFPYPWAADAIEVWDLDVPYDQHKGWMSGWGNPVWPLVPTVAQLDGGYIGHALAWVSAGLDDDGKSAGYSNEPWVGAARRTDGLCQNHPLRAGEVLRMNPDRAPKPKNRQEQTIIETLIEFGAHNTDRTGYDAGHALRMPGDPRFNVNLSLKADMFDVLVAA